MPLQLDVLRHRTFADADGRSVHRLPRLQHLQLVIAGFDGAEVEGAIVLSQRELLRGRGASVVRGANREVGAGRAVPEVRATIPARGVTRAPV